MKDRPCETVGGGFLSFVVEKQQDVLVAVETLCLSNTAALKRLLQRLNVYQRFIPEKPSLSLKRRGLTPVSMNLL